MERSSRRPHFMMFPNAGWVAACVAACVSGLALGRARAAEIHETGERDTLGGEGRVLNGHHFIKPGNFDAYSAFMNSSFEFRQGLGRVTFPASSLNGQASEGSLLLYSQGFFGQIGLGDVLSVDLGADGTAGIGGDLDSILNTGALATLGLGVMPKIRLLMIESLGLRAAIGLGGFFDEALVVSARPLLAASTTNDEQEQALEDEVISDASVVHVAPALLIAEGVGALGLQLSISAKLPLGESVRGALLHVNAHAALDLRSFTSFLPLALTGEYGIAKSFKEGEPSEYRFAAGLYYSGRRDIELGPVFRYYLLDPFVFVSGSLVMHYYF